MALAISRILGVPWSALKTLRASPKPTSTARTAVAMEKNSQNHSGPPRWNVWYPPSEAKFIVNAPPGAAAAIDVVRDAGRAGLVRQTPENPRSRSLPPCIANRSPWGWACGIITGDRLLEYRGFAVSGGMAVDREAALAFVQSKAEKDTTVRHLITVEGVMRRLAQHFGEDEAMWGQVGLFHDIDQDQTHGDMERHARVGAEWLRRAGAADAVGDRRLA